MKYAGKSSEDKILVELDNSDLKNFSIEYDYWKKPISVELKAGLLQQAKTELVEAKRQLEDFLKYNSGALENITKAGTLVGILFKNKQNSIDTI